jgi:hypothetical protein
LGGAPEPHERVFAIVTLPLGFCGLQSPGDVLGIGVACGRNTGHPEEEPIRERRGSPGTNTTSPTPTARLVTRPPSVCIACRRTGRKNGNFPRVCRFGGRRAFHEASGRRWRPASGPFVVGSVRLGIAAGRFAPRTCRDFFVRGVRFCAGHPQTCPAKTTREKWHERCFATRCMHRA